MVPKKKWLYPNGMEISFLSCGLKLNKLCKRSRAERRAGFISSRCSNVELCLYLFYNFVCKLHTLHLIILAKAFKVFRVVKSLIFYYITRRLESCRQISRGRTSLLNIQKGSYNWLQNFCLWYWRSQIAAVVKTLEPN